mgnify:CR=1 FL=1
MPFAAIGKAIANGETDGFIKVVIDAHSKLVLGVTIVGAHASDIISEAGLAIEMSAEALDIGLTIHPHPTLGESVMEATKAALGEAIAQGDLKISGRGGLAPGQVGAAQGRLVAGEVGHQGEGHPVNGAFHAEIEGADVVRAGVAGWVVGTGDARAVQEDAGLGPDLNTAAGGLVLQGVQADRLRRRNGRDRQKAGPGRKNKAQARTSLASPHRPAPAGLAPLWAAAAGP